MTTHDSWLCNEFLLHLHRFTGKPPRLTLQSANKALEPKDNSNWRWRKCAFRPYVPERSRTVQGWPQVACAAGWVNFDDCRHNALLPCPRHLDRNICRTGTMCSSLCSPHWARLSRTLPTRAHVRVRSPGELPLALSTPPCQQAAGGVCARAANQLVANTSCFLQPPPPRRPPAPLQLKTPVRWGRCGCGGWACRRRARGAGRRHPARGTP